MWRVFLGQRGLNASKARDAVVTTFPQRGTAAILDAATGDTIATTDVGVQPRDPGFVGGSFWVANQGDGSVTVLDAATGAARGSFRVPNAQGIFVAEGLLGDGWILHFGGSTIDRFAPDTGI